jgi:hypothetical protein
MKNKDVIKLQPNSFAPDNNRKRNRWVVVVLKIVPVIKQYRGISSTSLLFYLLTINFATWVLPAYST